MKALLEVSVILAGLAAFLAWAGVKPTPAAAPAASPSRADEPAIRRRPLFPLHAPATDGTEPMVDFPREWWFRNVGSKKDGAGMCVFCSMEFLARWAGLEEFKGYRDWCAERYPGGGYPAKLAKLTKAFCEARKIPKHRFDPDKDLIQADGESDPAFLDRCLQNGWACGITLYHAKAEYGTDPIYHCVVAAHLDDRRGAFLDNNPVTKDTPPYIWRTREDFLKAAKLNGRYWAFTIPFGPPPNPTN